MLSRKKIKPYNYKAIESAIGYIKNNLSDNLSLQAVSEYVKYSPYHFHKCFKKYMSILDFKDLVRDLRQRENKNE